MLALRKQFAASPGWLVAKFFPSGIAHPQLARWQVALPPVRTPQRQSPSPLDSSPCGFCSSNILGKSQRKTFLTSWKQ